MSIIKLKILLFIISIAIVVLGLIIFSLNFKLQETSIGTWISGLIFVISIILCKQAIQLDYPRARSSLLISCTLIIICGITSSRNYFQYKAFRELNSCASTSNFLTSEEQFTFKDEIFYGIGDEFYFDSAGYCYDRASQVSERIACSCYCHRQKNCYNFASSCYMVYVKMPSLILLISRLAGAALGLAIAICFLSMVALRITNMHIMDPVPTSVSAVQEVEPENDSKVIYLDEAHVIDTDDDNNDKIVKVHGFVSVPAQVHNATIL